MLTLFTLANLLNYLDRYLAAGVLPRILDDLNLTNEEGGYFLSAFVIGYVIFAPVFGVLGDRFHRGKLMALGVFLWSIATVLAGFATSFWTLLASRILVGVGEASYGSISPGYLKDRYEDPVRFNSALSIFYSAIPVGSALGYVFAGQIATHLSWHYAFFFCGAPGIVIAALLYRLPEHRIDPAIHEPVVDGLRAMLKSKILIFAVAGYILNCFALNAVAGFITKYGESIGFSLASITAYFGVILVGTGLIGTLLGGKAASVLASRSERPLSVMLSFIGVTSLLGLPFLASAFLVKSHAAFLILCTVSELLIFASTAPVNAVIVQSAPKPFITLTQGVTIFALNLFGSLPAPILVGYVADTWSLAAGMELSAVALLGSGVVWLIGGKVRHDG